MHHELVLIDQSQLRQRERKLHASDQEPVTWLPLELLNGLRQIPAHELRVPINPVEGARDDVLFRRIDRPGEGIHPIRPRGHPPCRPERFFHHLVSHPAKEERIGLVEVLDRVTMQVFVRDDCAMVAASVQRDVNGIPKGPHSRPMPRRAINRKRSGPIPARKADVLSYPLLARGRNGWLRSDSASPITITARSTRLTIVPGAASLRVIGMSTRISFLLRNSRMSSVNMNGIMAR